MREVISAGLGFLAVALVSGIMVSAFSWITDNAGIQGAGYIQASALVGLLASALAAIVFGVPAFLVLRYLKLIRWWSAAITGFVIGGFIGAGIVWSSSDFVPHPTWIKHVARNFLACGIFGAISAGVFWLIWNQGRTSGPNAAKSK